ncbi:MAG: T9SS type A sorting domain-containing protein, partial [Candidatus Marinimicrobia bacterium]|nr:T9SS type A sorting domain-containing protein [Candidatus Neomarinimicrobiota bacterium]
YDNLNPDPVETTRTIDFYVSDGSAHSDTLARNLSVTAINDAPILAGIEAAGLVYSAGAGAIVLTDSITVNDGDDVLIDSARVQITTNYLSSEDVLAYSTVYGITGVWYSGAGLLVLTGSNSMTDYEVALRTVTYENIQPNPQTSTRLISFTASDGLVYSTAVTRSISSGAPATITGLDLWLNANEGVYSNGAGTNLAVDADPIQVWKDQSGNGRDFVDNSGQPLLQTGVAGLNGASGVEFSGTGTAGMVDGDGELYMKPLSEFTTFFVVQSYSTGTDKGFMMLRNAGNGDKEYTVRYDATGDNGSQANVIKVAIGSDVIANEMESTAQVQTTDPQVICLDWKSGQVWDLYIDGVLNNPSYSGSPPTGTIASGTIILIGRGPLDTATSWDGLMAELIHYGKHLSDSERETIEDYLAEKYAISMRLLAPATGGDSLSADDANTTFTTLTGPRITEDAAGELTSGGTIILNAPSGFEWDTIGTLPSVAVQKAYGVSTALAVSYTSRTSSTITYTIDTPSNGSSQPGEVTFSGIKVRPTSANVPSTGEMTNSGTTGPSGATNLGTLTLIAGTPTKVVYTQEPSNGSTNTILSPAIQAEIQDGNDNVIQLSGTAVSIAISTGTGNLTGSTALNTDAQGSVSFSDLVIDANDTFQLTASSSGLTSAVSSNFTITTLGQFTTFLIEKASGGNVLTQDAGVDFNVKISAVDGTQTPDVNFTGTVDITSTGTLSNGSGTTAAFTAGVLSSHTLAISSVGNYTLTATNTSGSEYGTSNSFTVQSGAASVVTSTITASPAVLKNDASSTSTITVQLKDAGGNNKTTGGETVNLVATAGTLLGSVVDQSDGSYTQSLQSSSQVELSTITGVLNAVGMTDDASVQFNAYTHIWESDPGNDPYTSNWNDALNWDNGIPTLTSAVLIPTNPAQGTKYPTISTDNLQVASLSVETGADVTLSGSISFDILGDLAGAGDINGGSSDTIRLGGDMGIATSDIQYVEFNGSSLQTVTSPLSYTNITVDNASGVKGVGNVEVTGTLTLTNGSLILPSGYSLIADTKTITSGNIRAERELTGNTGWRLLATPVLSTYGDLFNNIFTQGYTGSDSSLGSPSVLWYDETYGDSGNTDNRKWRQPSNSTNATTAGRGLFVYVFGSIGGEPAYSDPLPITLDVSGAEEEGTAGVFDFGVTYTALADTGWNLVGNPFAATIDWDDAGWTKTNMDNVIYVWDHSANTGAGDYLTWNGTVGSLGSGLIPPFQGFWVKANAAAPVLKVPKTSKTTGGVFYKQAESPPLITIMIEADTLAATTFIDFNDQSSRNKDGRDAYYLIPATTTYLELYSVSHDNKAFTIQSHPYRFGRPVEFPLSVAGYVDRDPLGGTYRLSWPRVEGIPEEWTMTLEDLETGEIVDFESADYYEFEKSDHLNKRLKPLTPSPDLLKTKPFALRKSAVSDHPRFLLRIDPGDAFPEIPKDYALNQNYPNPFNEGTIIPFSLPLEAVVSATIFDIRGREIEHIIDNQIYQAGKYQFNWQASGRSSGIYFCHLSMGNQRFTRKMILLR